MDLYAEHRDLAARAGSGAVPDGFMKTSGPCQHREQSGPRLSPPASGARDRLLMAAGTVMHGPR